MKKLLGWAALAVAAMWLVKNPTGAASAVHQVVHALSTLAASL
jgi:hypothetical protein